MKIKNIANMKINFSSYYPKTNNSKVLNFCSVRKIRTNESLRQANLVETSLFTIGQDHQMVPTLNNISQLSGLPQETVVSVLNSYSLSLANNFSTSLIADKRCYTTDEILSRLNIAIDELRNNPDLDDTLAAISVLSGVSIRYLKNAIYLSEFGDIYDAWQNVKKQRADIKAQSDISAIEQALKQISCESVPDYRMSNISQLSGVPKALVSKRLNSKAGSSAKKIWQDLANKSPAKCVNIEITNSDQPSTNPEEVDKSTFLIQQAILELKSDPSRSATVEELSRICGLDPYIIKSKLFYSQDKELLQSWNNLLNERESLSSGHIFLKPSLKNKQKAFNMIMDAIRDGTKISYQKIYRETGLDKSQVDQLVAEYAMFKSKCREVEKRTKVEQAKWYEENVEKGSRASSCQSSFDEHDLISDQVDRIKDAILTASEDPNICVSYSEIARISGLSYSTVYSLINRKNFPELKEMFNQARSN